MFRRLMICKFLHMNYVSKIYEYVLCSFMKGNLETILIPSQHCNIQIVCCAIIYEYYPCILESILIRNVLWRSH